MYNLWYRKYYNSFYLNGLTSVVVANGPVSAAHEDAPQYGREGSE